MMPLPQRRNNESQAEFLNRCIVDEKMNTEYPNQKQRIAICMNLSTRNEYKDKDFLIGIRGAIKKRKK